MLRIFGLSDIHVDLTDNLACLEALPVGAYRNDVLILAGDVSHDLGRMALAFRCLVDRFERVFFVPGNHDLWVRSASGLHSLDRLREVLGVCRETGILTRPAPANGSSDSPWILPVFSWYRAPDEGTDSLFVRKPGEDPSLRMWSDRRFVRWPDLAPHGSPADYMLSLNSEAPAPPPGAPVITFSHFLPRRELIFSSPRDRLRTAHLGDPFPAFNFSRVAGCAGIDRHIKKMGASVHFYGHQHRDRCRRIDGITYVSHCLGYPRERRRNPSRGIAEGPRLIWDGAPIAPSDQ